VVPSTFPSTYLLHLVHNIQHSASSLVPSTLHHCTAPRSFHPAYCINSGTHHLASLLYIQQTAPTVVPSTVHHCTSHRMFYPSSVNQQYYSAPDIFLLYQYFSSSTVYSRNTQNLAAIYFTQYFISSSVDQQWYLAPCTTALHPELFIQHSAPTEVLITLHLSTSPSTL
jgi:hypothetical protein